MAKRLEDIEQKRLMRWVRDNLPEVWAMTTHMENEGKRTPQQYQHWVAMGGRPGYPDILIDYPANGFHGLRIELKQANGGKLSQPQRKWLERLNEQGFKAVCCHGFEEAKKVIEEYIGAE